MPAKIKSSKIQGMRAGALIVADAISKILNGRNSDGTAIGIGKHCRRRQGSVRVWRSHEVRILVMQVPGVKLSTAAASRCIRRVYPFKKASPAIPGQKIPPP
jgi:hypothetical protein